MLIEIRTKNIIKIITPLIVFALLLLCGCNNNNANMFQGYVEGTLIYVASPFSGKVEKLYVKSGDVVSKKQPLFVLDLEPERSQLNKAKEELKNAQAILSDLTKGQRKTILKSIKAKIAKTKSELVLAKVRLERFRTLYKKRVIEQDKLDEALATYKAKQSSLKQFEAELEEGKLGGREDLIGAQKSVVKAAQAALKKAEWALRQKSITSPVDSTVYDTFFSSGEFVPPNKPVLALLSSNKIYISFFVPATRLSEMTIGENVLIGCDNCKKEYTGTIYYISPQAEYTPPVIYSSNNNAKLVYKIKVRPEPKDASYFHPGQPVHVFIKK